MTGKRLSLREDTLVDIQGASELLGCTERYLRRLIHERRIPFVKLGGSKVRFSVAELEAWVEDQRVAARPV